MVKFLETTGVSAELTELIKSSEEKLFLISPYLQIADRLRHLIKNRKISFIFFSIFQIVQHNGIITKRFRKSQVYFSSLNRSFLLSPVC